MVNRMPAPAAWLGNLRRLLLLLLAYLALVQLLGGTKEYLDETNTGVFFANAAAAVVRALLMQ